MEEELVEMPAIELFLQELDDVVLQDGHPAPRRRLADAYGHELEEALKDHRIVQSDIGVVREKRGAQRSLPGLPGSGYHHNGKLPGGGDDATLDVSTNIRA